MESDISVDFAKKNLNVASLVFSIDSRPPADPSFTAF